MGQYSTPITGRLLALVFRSVVEDQEVNTRKLFNDFRTANDVLYWNLNLSEAVQACRLVGHLQPHTLLIEGFSADLNDIIEAWCKRLLKFPPGFVIENVGELRGLQFITVPQVVSIPLDDALCYIIYDLNCTERPSTFEVVCATLSRWYGGMQMPPLGLVHSALQRLMRSGLIYHTGYGYSILTSEKAQVVRWLTQLPSDLHDTSTQSTMDGCSSTPSHPRSFSAGGCSSSATAMSSSCVFRPSLSSQEATCSNGGIHSMASPSGVMVASMNAGHMSPVSAMDMRTLALQSPDLCPEEVNKKGNKSFLSRLFSRIKPRKTHGSPSGCLPLYSRDNPPPELSYPPNNSLTTSYSPPPPLQPHARMWASAWSPVCQGSRDSPISSGADNFTSWSHQNNTTSELVTTYSEGLLSDPNHLVTVDYRRQRGPGCRRPILATSAHLRHSFALGDSHSMRSPEVPESQESSVWGRAQTSRQRVDGNRAAVATATSDGGPLLSPPSTHDSGFNSSRTLLDLETSEPGGSGGTGASSFNAGISKAEMLKRRMGPEGSLD